MSENKPEITIIMPVYNSENYLRDAIESVLNQTFENFELILINDGSTDGSYKICDYYSKMDRRITVIHKKNGGICSARNLGLDRAHGKYIMFIDNDDFLDNSAMETGIHFMKSKNLDLFKFERTEYLIRDEVVLKCVKNNFKEKVYEGEDILQNTIRFRNNKMLTFVWDGIFKKEILDRNQILFNEEYKTGNEDIEFCLVYIQYCNRIMFYDKSLYNHYTRIGFSTSSKNTFKKYKDNLKLARFSRELFKKNGLDMEKNYVDYNNIVANSVLYPTCNLLNDYYGKKDILKKINKLKELQKENIFYYNIKKQSFLEHFKMSKRDSVYYFLFYKKYYFLLLELDRISRYIIFNYRRIKYKLSN